MVHIVTMEERPESEHELISGNEEGPAPALAVALEDPGSMHVHKVKPAHGWKEFLNEILIIVIGVLIALGLEQFAEEMHWRNKVSDAEERLKTEATANFSYDAEQVIVTPCILAQLDHIRNHLVSAEAKPLPADDFLNNEAVLRLPTRPWAKGTWEELEQDGTGAHFSMERQRYLGGLYHLVESMIDAVAQSGNASGRLLATSYGAPFSPETREALLMTVSEQYRRTQYMDRIALQQMGALRDMKLAPAPAQVNVFLHRMTFASNTMGFCRDRHMRLADWRAELGKIPPLGQRPY